MPPPGPQEMSSDLYYSLLRISTAQILRSAGIDRCPPSVLDTLTDITIRYLTTLCSRSLSYSLLAHSSFQNDVAECEPRAEDVRMALESLGMLRPMRLFDFSEEDVSLGLLAEQPSLAGILDESDMDVPGMEEVFAQLDADLDLGPDPAVDEFLDGIKETIKATKATGVEIAGLDQQVPPTDEEIKRDTLP
ncbi:uncharacterized protein V1510DRAFT_409015 [Dipodascopsis tothii]|uniref:uncharacterized protein n=1 Tax=Dipodascopsis tothii TaxID=44089 RepID=UPI0034CFCB4A